MPFIAKERTRPTAQRCVLLIMLDGMPWFYHRLSFSLISFKQGLIQLPETGLFSERLSRDRKAPRCSSRTDLRTHRWPSKHCIMDLGPTPRRCWPLKHHIVDLELIINLQSVTRSISNRLEDATLIFKVSHVRSPTDWRTHHESTKRHTIDLDSRTDLKVASLTFKKRHTINLKPTQRTHRWHSKHHLISWNEPASWSSKRHVISWN